MSLALFRFVPTWAYAVGLGLCAVLAAIIVFGGRDW